MYIVIHVLKVLPVNCCMKINNNIFFAVNSMFCKITYISRQLNLYEQDNKLFYANNKHVRWNNKKTINVKIILDFIVLFLN